MKSGSDRKFGSSRRNGACNIPAVVICITKDYWILEHEISDPRKERMFRMTRESWNISNKAKFPRMRETVIIREIEEKPCKYTPPFVPPTFVKRFQYTPNPARKCIKDEIMAVAQVSQNYVSLVGKSFNTEIQACVPYDTNELSVGQLVIGSLVEMPMYVDVFKPKTRDVVFYKFNFKAQKHANRKEIECPEPLWYPEGIRPLTPEEEKLVFTRCASLPEIDLVTAQRFVQEPLIAAGLLEKYVQYQEVVHCLVSVQHNNLGIDGNGVPFFTFFIDISKYFHLFQSQKAVSWRVGGEVQVAHRQLRLGGKEREVHMIIRRATASKSGYTIELVSTSRSREFLKAAFSYSKAFEEEMFYIAPIFENRDATVESVRNNFDEFFLERRHLFDLCTGRVEKPEEVEIVDREKPFLVNENPLDASQLGFMRSAASIPGFTCAQAPPGCGKTHTTSALVSNLKNMRVKGGICISGTTNAAVTNAADAVASRFPDIRITREYSLKAEGDITAISVKTSLKHMAAEAGKYVDLEKHTSLKGKLKKMKNAKEQLNYRAPNLHQHLSRVHNATQLEKNVKNGFVQAYNLQVYATTIELMIRRGDIFRGCNEEEDKSVRRLILDEAAQMSPLEGMALYCSFPHLEYITLLGDMKQLGPHSSLPPGSDCYNLISVGELTRMYKLPSTTKRELNTIYRCHPAITEKFLVPIYGPQMKCGVSAAARSLAKDRGLLVAKDGSPCVFIDIDGAEDKGRNYMEMRTALDLIYDIVDLQGVPAEDVVVICNHRAQMNSLVQELKDEGVFGPLKTKVAIHTVDSFQGKEAKVVILLTTKTCGLNDDGEKMKFVGHPARGTVAVSRAQHALYILGHWQSLAKTPFWSQFLKSMIVAGGIVNKYFEESDVIPKLRAQIKFSVQETVEELRAEVIEPQQVENDDEDSSKPEFSDDGDSVASLTDDDDLWLDDLLISSPQEPSTSAQDEDFWPDELSVDNVIEAADVIAKLKTEIKFSVQETVEDVKTEVKEPQQVETDDEGYSKSEFSDVEDSGASRTDDDLWMEDFFISCPQTSSAQDEDFWPEELSDDNLINAI